MANTIRCGVFSCGFSDAPSGLAPYGSSGHATMTTVAIPEVDKNYDPCSSESTFISPAVANEVTMVEVCDYYIVSNSWGAQCKKSHLEEQGELPTVITLRRVSGGVELLGCNDTSKDAGYSEDIHTDSYFVSRDSNSWEMEFVFDYPYAKSANGVWDGKIFMFGGVYADGWTANDVFHVYDTINETYTVLDNGGLSARSSAYGYCYDGFFYMYGGYSIDNNPPTFISEFWKYDIANGTWHSLPIPALRRSNKIVGGHGKIYLPYAMIPLSYTNQWDWDGKTYAFDIATESWSIVQNGTTLPTPAYTNFDTFVYHKGGIYYFIGEKLVQILTDREMITEGVSLPQLTYNPLMASWGDYIIFSHGVGDGGTGVSSETRWFNTVTRMYGSFSITGELPLGIIGQGFEIIGDYIYMIGGIPEYGQFDNKIWKLNLKHYFANIDTKCGFTPVPPDEMRVIAIYACRAGYCDRNNDDIPDWYQEFVYNPFENNGVYYL